ncbi:outer membrane homotrimeric porin [Pseudodesulfovibrio thermohalotolerans]|uniref:outer membrane homotrimeric porin n=1 Tax=Pseudodesulfovibrio thermohalotolerans TaxID=2880651 RepID=UPI0022BA0413|nr:outer membrane homotrimeric porin [Pseudodesulfovibrio thermohalotolerans]WFS61341.1 outer membrane homotrimeric porin [Pseudodesulfovibrio thermohalotolerans]
MKRLTLLAVALVMVLGMAVSASAAPEVSISGNLLVNAVWMDNWNFNDSERTKNFNIVERADLYFTVTANENLKGVLGLRSQKSDGSRTGRWGGPQFGLDNPGGVNAATLGVRDAYIDFNWPGTDVNVKAGVYTVGLPQAVGGASMIVAERAGAVMVSAPLTENIGVLAGYTRLYDNDDNSEGFGDSYLDGYLVAVPLTFEGVSATPYFLYGNAGDNFDVTTGGALVNTEDEDAAAYWVGTDFTLSVLDPFIIKADLAYGNLDSDTEANEASGWMFDVALDYTGFDFMTASAYFVYTSGADDDNSDGLESMPVLQGDWAVGSFYFGGGSITGDDLDAEDGNRLGFWVLGLSLTDIQSFAQGLTHDFHVLYVQGTNDEDSYNTGDSIGSYLTEEDSLWEVDFNTTYALYDNLSLIGQVGYISSDFDEDVWGSDVENDAWKIATGVVYKF